MIGFCCITLGRPARRTDAAYSDELSFGQLYQDYSLDDLRDHMTRLVEQVRIRPEFLIPGLFHFLIEHFAKVSDSANVSSSIDFHLEILEELQEELEKPQDRRKDKLTDAQINSLLEKTKDMMSRKPAQRQGAEQLMERLQAEWNARFSDDYWQDFGLRSIQGD